VGVHCLGIDAQGHQLLPAAHHCRHHAAPGAGLDGALLQFLLQTGHLGLHLLDLLHHLLDVHKSSSILSGLITRPPKSRSTSWTAGGYSGWASVCPRTWKRPRESACPWDPARPRGPVSPWDPVGSPEDPAGPNPGEAVSGTSPTASPAMRVTRDILRPNSA